MLLIQAGFAFAHGVPVVLVIYDTANSDTTTLCSTIDADHNMTCDMSTVAETSWDGTNPSLSGYDVVLHMTGTTSGDMPAAGQTALVNFVNSGGGYLHFEYLADEYDNDSHYSSMRELVLFDSGSAKSGSVTWTDVAAQSGHRVLYNTASSFSFTTRSTVTTAHTFSSNPVTVLMTDSNGGDAIAVREVGSGRVVGFNTAGNAGSNGVFADATIEQLLLDAIVWAGACDEDNDGVRSYACYGLDCDDADDAVYWAATEYCNGYDDDCDLVTDEGGAVDALTWYEDSDGDGYGNVNSYDRECWQPTGWVADYEDCDDNDATEHPGADEYCDSSDDDCDGAIDESGAVDAQTWYGDGDGDGHGDAASPIEGECLQPSGASALDDDCDDADGASYPGATETAYDGVDQDCDGEDLCDVDLDGHDAVVCAGLDCDDTDGYVHPKAVEVWYDGVDQDCDGSSDYDADEDGFDSKSYGGEDCDDGAADRYPGAPDDPYDGIIHDCDATDEFDGDADGYKSAEHEGDDCDDASSLIHPGAREYWYDGVDQDCNGLSDYDADVDGYDSRTYEGDDCDDADALTYPGAPDEPYDGLIQDCDDADEWDVDGDGYRFETDCDDANSAVNPGATEVWDDGIDQDCDGEDSLPELEDTEPQDTGGGVVEPPKTCGTSVASTAKTTLLPGLLLHATVRR